MTALPFFEGMEACSKESSVVMRHLLVGVAFFGGLSAAVSPLRAQTWVEMTAPSTNIGPIACSADGSKLVLAGGGWYNQGGVVYVSHDSGATWTAADVPVGWWDAVASSADGTTLMATELLRGLVYTSNDSGATWSLNHLPVELWDGVACSADGTKLFAAGAQTTNGPPGGIYASVDSGKTWFQTGAPAAAWAPLACSADGSVIVAGEGANVWVSTNSGASSRLAYALAPPYIATGDSTLCMSLACSADGTRMAAGSAARYYYPWAGIASSADGGGTWTFSTNGVAGMYYVATVSYSADGGTVAAVGPVPAPTPGGGLPLCRLLLSSDSGASWGEAPAVPWLQPPGVTSSAAPWTGAAMSADGCKLVAVYMSGCCGVYAGAVVTLQTMPRPALGIARAAGGLVLSWIVPSMSFVLQESPDLGRTSWTDVPGAPVLDYSTLRNQMTVPAPAGPMFYRLISRQ